MAIIISEPPHTDLAAMVSAGAAVFASFVALASTYVALVSVRNQTKSAKDQIDAATRNSAMQSRANVVSASRQRWIDALREDIAEFLTVDSEHKGFDRFPSQDPLVNLEANRQSARLLSRQMLLYKRIRLRLNPEEDEHEDLRKNLNTLITKHPNKSGELAEEIICQTQAILKTEWKRLCREASGDMELSTPAISSPPH